MRGLILFFRLTKTLKERESWFEKQLQKKIGNYSKRSKFFRMYAVYNITDLRFDRHICSNFEDMLMLGPLKCESVNLIMNLDRKKQWSEFSIDADPKARNKTTKAAKKEKQGLISE